MKKSLKASLSTEQRVLRIQELQGYLISGVYPSGMSRKDASMELMRLRNTRRKEVQGPPTGGQG